MHAHTWPDLLQSQGDDHDHLCVLSRTGHTNSQPASTCRQRMPYSGVSNVLICGYSWGSTLWLHGALAPVSISLALERTLLWTQVKFNTWVTTLYLSWSFTCTKLLTRFPSAQRGGWTATTCPGWDLSPGHGFVANHYITHSCIRKYTEHDKTLTTWHSETKLAELFSILSYTNS